MATLSTFLRGDVTGVNMNLLWPTGASSTIAAADVVTQTANQFSFRIPGGFTLTYFGAGMTYAAVPGGVQVTAGTYAVIQVADAVNVMFELSGAGAQPMTAIFAATTPADVLSATDTISGGAAADSLFGAGGADTINAGDGDDFVYGAAGNDTLNGGNGADTFVYAASTEIGGTEIVNGGAGIDTILVTGPGSFDFRSVTVTSIERAVFQHASGAASISLLSSAIGGPVSLVGTANVEAFNVTLAPTATIDATGWGFFNFTPGVDSLSLIGTAAGDAIIGSSFGDTLLGLAGNDTLSGGGGQDFIFGGGLDIAGAFLPGSGADSLSGGLGDDRMWGMDENDAMQGEDGNDALTGGAGNDSMFGGAGDDFLFGGDFVGGGFGAGSGNDFMYGEAGRDALYGFDGDDFIDTGIGDDYVEGGDGADNIVGGSGNSFLLGGAGADAITGGGGFDYLYGNAGADLFNFRLGDSYDWVLDFSVPEGDRLRLDPAFGITTFAQFQAAIVTGVGFTQLTRNGGLDQITLFGVGTGQWTAGMVEFM